MEKVKYVIVRIEEENKLWNIMGGLALGII
jgi:hypothetical protein